MTEQEQAQLSYSVLVDALAERDTLLAPTANQYRALHKLGRSRHFIHRYCPTKHAASLAIQRAIEDMTAAKQLEGKK